MQKYWELDAFRISATPAVSEQEALEQVSRLRRVARFGSANRSRIRAWIGLDIVPWRDAEPTKCGCSFQSSLVWWSLPPLKS